MKPFYRDLRLTIIVAIIAFAVCWMSNSWFSPHRVTPEDTSHDRLHAQLHLTKEQEQKLHPIEDKFDVRKAELESKVRDACRGLSEVMLKDMAYSDEVKRAVKRIQDAQDELQEATIEHFYDMQAVLTPEQTKTLHHLAAEALLKH